MTLIIENADAKVLEVVKSLKAFNPKLNIQKSKDKTAKQGKKPSKRLLKAMKESEEILKNPHLYPSYASAAELREALERE